MPASVTPLLRFPLFWLSCHNLPASLYRWLCKYAHRHDGYFVTYFHPWEFYSLNEHPEWKLPFIIRNHAGEGMEKGWMPSSYILGKRMLVLVVL